MTEHDERPGHPPHPRTASYTTRAQAPPSPMRAPARPPTPKPGASNGPV